MKYLVIKDCPGFKVGDVVETYCNGFLKSELNIIPEKYPEYFQPMWFNFGDKIKRISWSKGYFVPERYDPVSKSFHGVLKKGTPIRCSDCLDKSQWEFYKEKQINGEQYQHSVFDEFGDFKLNKKQKTLLDDYYKHEKLALVNAGFVEKKEETPKPKKLLAPALYKNSASESWAPTTSMYASLEEAKYYTGFRKNIVWPAKPNKDGFYEVEE